MNGVIQFQEEEVKLNFRWFDCKIYFQVNFSKISERKRERERKRKKYREKEREKSQRNRRFLSYFLINTNDFNKSIAAYT